jgi:hypothetical protein
MCDAIAAHLGSRQVSRVLYGSIIGLALVLALEAHPPGAGAITVTLLATAVAVALAELYSEIVGTEVQTARGSDGSRSSTCSTRSAPLSRGRCGRLPAYSPSCFPRISFITSSVPPPIGPRRVSRTARSISYSFM